MEDPTEYSSNPSNTYTGKREAKPKINGKNLTTKGFIIGGITVVLLLLTGFIGSLVNERQNRRTEAIEEVSSKWANTQTISGPIVSIPYLEYFKDTGGTVTSQRRYIHVLPESLKINGKVVPEKRYRGIYEIVVYNSQLTLEGDFSETLGEDFNIPKQNILYNQAFLSVGITDLRGIEEKVTLNWGGSIIPFNPGIETSDVLSSGINCPLSLIPDSFNKATHFTLALTLKGSEFIHFTPLGKETEVTISSTWSDPSFDGAFLPDKREVTPTGFSAYWKVLHLNRNFPQSWLNGKYSINEYAFGVDLIYPVDSYSKTDRSVKYAILFIGLTFLVFFFLEVLNDKNIHPFQYILIGFALCIFYIILLSVSEHLNYSFAYLIASIMTIGLIFWYSRSILVERKLSLMVGANLLLMYGFIYTIIQLQDYALLMGSLGLFIILTVIMHFSRKINWKGLVS